MACAMVACAHRRVADPEKIVDQRPTHAVTVPTPAPTLIAAPMPLPSYRCVMVFHFDFDRSEILASEKPMLDTMAECIKANHGDRFLIIGHADERGTQEYNLA